MQHDKLITYTVPCYNSAAYMDRCIESILACSAPDIEVIIVDDGSTKDETAEKADDWARRYPDVVRAIHQENGGHGAAVMTGIQNARGLYFKVVDSDDWLDNDANLEVLETLQRFSEDEDFGGGVFNGGALAGACGEGGSCESEPPSGETLEGATHAGESCDENATEDAPLDLLVCNYVYEHVSDGTERVMGYGKQLPSGHVFSWDDIGRFDPSQYMLMHALIYRTDVLRMCGLKLPHHTFYVDVIYAYVPLPWCRRLYYLDVAPYRYLVGREDQSVNEQVMIGLRGDQLRVTRAVIDAYRLEDIENDRLRGYMVNYLAISMVASTVFCYLAGTPEDDERRKEIWAHLKERDPWAYKAVRKTFTGAWVSWPGRLGRDMTVNGYKLVRKIFKFN
jgi:glycosyltransferase involved in cell wall biosynthesis